MQKTAKIGHRNEQIARTFKWFTGCVKFDKEKKLCNNCAEIRETRLVYSRKERKIRLSDTEEVKEFVRAAGKCDFDIDVCYNRAVIDAKSLLGMLYLGLSKDLTVKYGGQNTGFENTVQKYAVC